MLYNVGLNQEITTMKFSISTIKQPVKKHKPFSK